MVSPRITSRTAAEASDVLAKILPVKDYIFDHYASPESRHLRWCDEDYTELDGDITHSAQSLMLTAQLDQMNAYLMLMAPILRRTI